MNKYAISEYTWVPYEEGEDQLPECDHCKYLGKMFKMPCRCCEALPVPKGEPRGRNYFKQRDKKS